MATYEIDRKLLESKSTEEISKILRDERDDYTPEAIEILEQILKSGERAKSSFGRSYEWDNGSTGRTGGLEHCDGNSKGHGNGIHA